MVYEDILLIGPSLWPLLITVTNKWLVSLLKLAIRKQSAYGSGLISKLLSGGPIKGEKNMNTKDKPGNISLAEKRLPKTYIAYFDGACEPKKPGWHSFVRRCHPREP